MGHELRKKVIEVMDRAKSVVFGQDEMLEAIVAALVCEGHLLIEGMPGLGKTLSVSLVSKLCDVKFNRIQFTPDLLPSDLIGTMVYNQSKEEFSTKLGPIFTQIVLADEINRSPAKVQSALLEAMAEKQVTIGETTHKLPSPFVVLATQNPIEQEGTYNLPEAQLDRFMMKVGVGYPSYEAEKNILSLGKSPLDDISKLLSVEEITRMQEEVGAIYVDDKIKDLIVRIVHATRPTSEYFRKEFDGAVIAGASPRASIWLYKISKFKAFLDDKDYVTPEHVLSIVEDVLGHRILLSYEAIIDKMSSKDIAKKIANAVI
jgi:MoxR-like ATPase